MSYVPQLSPEEAGQRPPNSIFVFACSNVILAFCNSGYLGVLLLIHFFLSCRKSPSGSEYSSALRAATQQKHLDLGERW